MKNNLFEITQTLIDFIDTLNPSKKNIVIKQLNNYISTMGEMEKVSSPIDLSKALNQNVDEFMEEKESYIKAKLNKDISCSIGCDFCCYSDVTISLFEALAIVDYCNLNNIEIDIDKLKSQADKEDWDEVKYADRKCVFLDSKSRCKIYDVRPNSCRKYCVVSSPEKCNQESNYGGKVERVISLESELITSASFNITESDGLSKLIIRSMGNAS